MAHKRHRVRLRRIYVDVLRTYFPRWTAGRSWNLRWETLSPLTNEKARCVPERRVILVNPDNLERSSEQLEYLLVHECCHAVTTQGHGVQWLRQMRRATERAKSLGRARVNELLTEDITEYEGSPTNNVGISSIRQYFKHALSHVPNARFDMVLRRLCEEESMSLRMLHERFPALRHEFRKAKSENDDLIAAERALWHDVIQ